ncbi:MAG: hypothetical protein LYZ66_06110 [Nitrososphaerales archaeon]|nr:hypothetical protein [Nitrososphaerales archaeon]
MSPPPAAPAGIAGSPTSITPRGATQWTELGPKPIVAPSAPPNYYGTAPFSGRVTALAVNSSNSQNIYLGAAQGGVWRSLDGGNSWTPLTDNQASLAIGAIALSPDGRTIYAGTGEPNHSGDSASGAGLLKSTDGGKTWTVLGSTLFTGSSIAGILVNGGSPNRVLVTTTSGTCCRGFYRDANQSAFGVYLTLDGGNTWTATLASRDHRVTFADIVAQPGNTNTVFVSSFNGTVWESKDAGGTWSRLFYSLSPACATSSYCRVALAISGATPNSLFAAMGSSTGNLYGIYSDDLVSGTITPLNFPPNPPRESDPCSGQCDYDLVMAADPSNAGVLYFGALDLYVSTNGGSSWTDLGGYSPGVIHPDQHALAFFPGSPSSIINGNDGGVWKSGNRGATWTNINAGLAITQFYSIAGSPDSFLIGGNQDNGCVQYRGSVSWPEVEGGDGGWSGVERTNPSIVYCAYTNLDFRKSTDGGTTWRDAITGLNQNDQSRFIAPVAQDPSNPGTLYIGGTHVYKTTNFATSWTDVSGSIGTTVVTDLAVAPTSSNTVYLGDLAGNLKVSNDGGTTWQSLGSITGYAISGIAVDPTNANQVYVSAAYQNTLYSFSLQSGTWQKTQLGNAPDRIDVVRINSARNLFVGTDHGVLYSTDSGATWALPGTGLPNVAVYDIEIVSNQVVAATHGRGAWIVTPTPSPLPTLTVSYSVVGGASGYTPPTLTYVSNGVTLTASLSSSPQSFSLDAGSSWSVRNPLVGSSSIERWLTDQTTSGTITSSQSIALTFYHQSIVDFNYNVTGGGTGYSAPTITYAQFGLPNAVGTGIAVWADAPSSFSYPSQLGGSTANERWAVATTSGSVSNSGQISIPYFHQYYVALSFAVVGTGNPGAPSLTYSSLSASASISLRTNPQSVWADAGSRYVSTNPLAGSTASERWYSANNNGTTSSSSALAFSYNHQYLLTIAGRPTSSVFLNEGIQLTIPTPLVSRFSNGTGYRISALATDNGPPQSEPLTKGNITLSITMNRAHTYVFTYLTQYEVTLDATAEASLSSITPPTITGDNYWYDSGTSVSVVLNGVWGRSSGTGSRLASYAINGGAQTVASTTSAVGALSLSSITSAQSVSAISVTQYLVSFQFTNAAGTKTIVPTDLQIAIGAQSQAVPGFSVWLDGGTQFTVSSVTYEGVEVRPTATQQYSATAPAVIAVKGSVYDATLKVTDFLGLAVSGAEVKMTLANGTVLSGSTDGDGNFVARSIPLGRFSASVSSYGSSSQVTGDASKQTVTSASVLFGTTSVGAVVGLVFAAAVAAMFTLRRRSSGRKIIGQPGPQVLRQTRLAFCSNCGAPTSPSESFCENCGAKLG